MKKRIKPGEYSAEVQKKGESESFCHAKEGQVFFTINTGNNEGFDTLSQESAIIISALIRIEKLLRSHIKEE